VRKSSENLIYSGFAGAQPAGAGLASRNACRTHRKAASAHGGLRPRGSFNPFTMRHSAPEYKKTKIFVIYWKYCNFAR